MKNWLTKLLFLSLFVFASFGVAHAQDTSSMTGTVTDASGAVIPGTVVTLTNKSTNVTLKETTNNQGTYRFASVPAGDGYSVNFSHDGFAALEVTKVALAVGTPRTQDAKLTAGRAETVEVVSSGNVTLNTTDSTIGNNVNVESLNQLPVYDRTSGIQTLFNLQPGVTNTYLDQVDGVSGSVTGARTDQSNVSIDGLDVNDISAGTTFGVIASAPIDSIEQFTGSVAGLTSGVGTGAGGQFQMVTKHGTNQWHGNINEYHRDVSTVANSYFNNLDKIARPGYIRNQFGGNVGGPIIKDKLFFFFDYAGSRIRQSGSTTVTVPMASFDSTTPTLNYINSNPGCSDTSRLSTAPQCISTLNQAQVQALDPAHMGFNTAVLGFLRSRYPAPNDNTLGDGVNTAGLRFTYPEPANEDSYVGRVDYNLTHSQKIYGRFTINRTNEVYPNGGGPQFPGDPDQTLEVDHSYGYVVSHIWTIGNNKVNQFYYGDNISKLNFPAPDFPTSPNVYSFSGLSDPYGTYNSQERRVPVPVVRDDFNWQVGSHSLTMGGQFKFIKTNSNSISDFNFINGGVTGTFLGQGLDPSVRPADIYTSSAGAALLDYDNLFTTGLGAIGSASAQYNYTASGAAVAQGVGGPRAYRFFETEAYFGDTWKLNRQLTLSYGVRYQLYSVPYEVHGNESISQLAGMTPHQSTFNAAFSQRVAQNAAGASGPTALPLFQEVLGGKANNGPTSYEPSYKDFAPRFALAYNPTWSPKTVFNAGAGIVYDRTVINAINFLQDQISFLFFNSTSNEFGASGAGSGLANIPRLGASGGKLTVPNGVVPASQTLKTPYTPYVDGSGLPNGLASEELGFVIDPALKDPYSIALNAGVQQEFPGHIIMKLNYAGRLGRRLTADADEAQVLNFPDKASGRNLSQAFGNVTRQLRAGADPESAAGLVADQWFENVIGNFIPGGCTQFGYANCTSLAADTIGQYGNRGDIGDAVATLFGAGALPYNVGMPAQFGGQAYLTNKGSSNYHALLLTLQKNFSQGLQFDFNYTWAHSIDNTSLTANKNSLYSNSGFICDVTQPRACRGNSDFDIRQTLTADFTYDLPFGRGRAFAANDALWLDEVIGGWSVSGIPSYRTGIPVNVYSDAYNASPYNADPAIFTGNPGDLKASVNKVGSTVYNFAGGSTGAKKVLAEFRGPIGLEYGQRNLVHGPGAFNLDLGLAKKFALVPAKNINLQFRADAFNAFNHPNFLNPTLNIVTNISPFGQITNTTGNQQYRVAQFSARVEF